MSDVESKIIIPGCDREAIWKHLIDFERYPALMRDVLDVKWLDQQPDGGTSEWTVLLNGSELNWVERDVFTDLKRVGFELVEGDVEVWRGYWLIGGDFPEHEVVLYVEFDIGIPSLAGVLHPIGARAIRANCVQMLEGLRVVSEAEHTSG